MQGAAESVGVVAAGGGAGGGGGGGALDIGAGQHEPARGRAAVEPQAYFSLALNYSACMC